MNSYKCYCDKIGGTGDPQEVPMCEKCQYESNAEYLAGNAQRRISQLEAKLAAVKEAFSKFDKSNWTFTTGDGLQAYHELIDALSK